MKGTEAVTEPPSWLLTSVPFAALQHHAYCPRQAWLIHHGTWADNTHTATGTVAHQRVDTDITDHRQGLTIHHHVSLSSHDLATHGVADTVEELPDQTLRPVEHKLGRGDGDLTPSILQATAQALCLREMTNRPVREAVVYIVNERRRETISVNDWVSRLRTALDEYRATVHGPHPPPVAPPRQCASCSLQDHCQPDQHRR